MMDPVDSKVSIGEEQMQIDIILICIGGEWKEADSISIVADSSWCGPDPYDGYFTLQIQGYH